MFTLWLSAAEETHQAFQVAVGDSECLQIEFQQPDGGLGSAPSAAMRLLNFFNKGEKRESTSYWFLST